MVEFEIDDEGVLSGTVILFIDLVESSQYCRLNIDWSAIDEQVMIVAFNEEVIARTAAFYLVEDEALEERTADIDEVVSYALI